MTQDMSFIKQKLSRVTDFMQKNSRDIELLSGELHNSEHCIQELIGELNCMQANMRRKNVKIDRLKDTGKIPGGLVDKVVQTLNAYFIGRDYTHDSIEHASRVGKRCWSLRPVIMCFPKYGKHYDSNEKSQCQARHVQRRHQKEPRHYTKSTQSNAAAQRRGTTGLSEGRENSHCHKRQKPWLLLTLRCQ